MIGLLFDFLLGRMVVDQVKYHGVDTDIAGLKIRMDTAEENIAIFTPPIPGTYDLGDWSQENVIVFAAWTA